MKALKEADDFAKETMDSLVSTISQMSTVSLRKGINVKSDPENPMNLSSFGNMPKENQIAVVMEYLGNSIDFAKKGEGQLSQLLTRMSDLMMERGKDKAVMMSGVKAINSLFTKLTATASENTDVSEDWEETFESNFNNYDFNKLFS